MIPSSHCTRTWRRPNFQSPSIRLKSSTTAFILSGAFSTNRSMSIHRIHHKRSCSCACGRLAILAFQGAFFSKFVSTFPSFVSSLPCHSTSQIAPSYSNYKTASTRHEAFEPNSKKEDLLSVETHTLTKKTASATPALGLPTSILSPRNVSSRSKRSASHNLHHKFNKRRTKTPLTTENSMNVTNSKDASRRSSLNMVCFSSHTKRVRHPEPQNRRLKFEICTFKSQK